jgi:hypothetical protein
MSKLQEFYCEQFVGPGFTPIPDLFWMQEHPDSYREQKP